MLFNSTLYLVFLPVACVLYYLLPLAWRRAMLLVASYAFYWVWSVPYSALLAASTIFNFALALALDRSERESMRRAALTLSVCANLGVLGLFKYADFLSGSLESLLGFRPWAPLLLTLPLAISFYTFETMSYTIDVFRRQMRARRDPMDMALFVSFFPHLLAGPIIRADRLMPQLRRELRPNWPLIRSGIAMILWGMGKKVFVADSMSPIVKEAYGSPELMSGLALLGATYAFAIQIYCDFSGYSDIAIGSAMLFGVELPENFRAPYMSCSIREFWRRWHISLSTWLRDYLYIPLGGGRKGISRTYANLMITMLLGGLWHGAGWNWVVWGGLQGGLMIAERLAGISEEPPAQRGRALLRWFVTFHLVCLSWVFFRADGVDAAFQILARVGQLAEGQSYAFAHPIALLALLLVAELSQLRARALAWAAASETRVLWAAVAAYLILLLTFRGASNPEFIYFQF